ncbi:hypothetical protein EV122DRAFT_289323 [Schizophyllum commune]
MLSKHASSNACDTRADALETLDCALARLDVRDGLGSSSESQLELAASVYRVPTEIWEDIFLRACADTILEYPLHADMISARSLGRVCQRWRDIALDDTRLWVAFISIDMDRLMRLENDVRDFCIAISLYLARSADQTLSVEMYWGGTGLHWSDFSYHLEDECYGDLRRLLRALSRSFWRWEDCVISGNILEHISRDQYPESLKSCCILDGTTERMDQMPFQYALCLRSWTQEDDSVLPRLPFEQLTHMKLGAITYDCMAKILAHCDALEDLEVEVDEGDRWARRFPANAWLPNLRNCVYKSASLSVLKGFLQCLHAPSLEFLELDGPKDTSGWAWPSEEFSRFLECDGHPTSLILHVGLDISDDAYYALRSHSCIFQVDVCGRVSVT